MYSYSTNGDSYQGEYPTVEAALENASDCYAEKNEPRTIWVGETVTPVFDPRFIGDDTLDRIATQLWEEVGDAAEHFKHTTAEQTELGQLILDWIARNGGFQCFGLTNIKEYEIPAREPLAENPKET